MVPEAQPDDAPRRDGEFRDGDLVHELRRSGGRERRYRWVVDARGRDLGSGPIPLNDVRRSRPEPFLVPRERLRLAFPREPNRSARVRLLDPHGPDGVAVAAAVTEGLTASQTAIRLGLPRARVLKLAAMRGVVFARGSRAPTYARETLADASAARDLEEAAKILGCDVRGARSALRRAGLSLPPRPLRVSSITRGEALTALREQGTLELAGKRLGVSRETVVEVLRLASDGDAVTAAAAEGLTASQTASRLGLPRPRVVALAAMRGVALARRPQVPSYSSEKLAEAADAQDREDAAKILGCGLDAAEAALRRAGLRVPPTLWRTSRIRVEDALTAFREEGTLELSGKRLGVSRETVRLLLRGACKDGNPEALALVKAHLPAPRDDLRSEEFGERFAQLLRDSGVTKGHLSRRLATTLGRCKLEAWRHWLDRLAGGERPEETELLGALRAARFLEPEQVLEWLLGRRRLAPWGRDPAAEPEAPRSKPVDADRLRRQEACRTRLRRLVELTGLTRRAFARRLATVADIDELSIYVQLYRLEKGRNLFPEDRLVRWLRGAGFREPERAVAWLYGKIDEEPWADGALLVPPAEPLGQARKREAPATVCDAPGCGRVGTRRRSCEKHNQQTRARGRLTRPTRPSVCSAQGCGGKHKAMGLCQTHFDRERPRRVPKTCSVPGCVGAHKAMGLCQSHHDGVKRKRRKGRRASAKTAESTMPKPSGRRSV